MERAEGDYDRRNHENAVVSYNSFVEVHSHTNHIHVDYGYNRVNCFCQAIGEGEIGWIDYNRAVYELLKLKCIDITEEVIWLRESISKEWR